MKLKCSKVKLKEVKRKVIVKEIEVEVNAEISKKLLRAYEKKITYICLTVVYFFKSLFFYSKHCNNTTCKIKI